MKDTKKIFFFLFIFFLSNLLNIFYSEKSKKVKKDISKTLNNQENYTNKTIQNDKDHIEFIKFKTSFSKTYSNKIEEISCFNIFKKNIKKANNLQIISDISKKKVTYGITKFSDMSEDYFKYSFNTAKTQKNLYETDIIDNSSGDLKYLKININTKLPENFSWEEKKVVTRIKDQKKCGSCWTFAISAVIESQIAIKHGYNANLSEQNLLDCDVLNFGCDGGWILQGFEYTRINGLMLEADYPYVANQRNCKYDKNLVYAKVDSHYSLKTQNEEEIKAILFDKGPLLVGINAGPLHLYIKGILDLDHRQCNTRELNHAVVLIGYGVENGVKYWKFKNSWGTNWGEIGFFRLAFGKGVCGITKEIYVVSIE